MLPETERILASFLKRTKEEEASGGFVTALLELLEQIQHLRGVAGAALVSAWPRSLPEPPLLSSAWDAAWFEHPDSLRELAQHLSRVRESTYHRRSHADSPAMRWLAGGLRPCDPIRLALVPLRPFVPEAFAGVHAFDFVLVVAFRPPAAGAAELAEHQPYREDLEFLAWVITHARINLESPRLALRHKDLAVSIDEGVTQLLTQTPPWQSGQTHFGQLVENIRALMCCDTCQLYLLPKYASCIQTKPPDRVWLVAEQVAERAGLRYGRNEKSLVSYLWRNAITAPLNLPNLLENPDFATFALTKLGLTRHFLGMLLTARPYEVLGVISLRDKYVRSEDGDMSISEDGFTANDSKRLEHRVAELTRMLVTLRAKLHEADAQREIQAEVESIRSALSADTCGLFLTPDVIGGRRTASQAYVELYYHARQHWLCEANYGLGERLTGQVLAGQPTNESDVLLRFRDAQPNGYQTRSRPGKYRLSQHFLAVPVPAPVGFGEDSPARGAIGVLKVRDRLEKDHVTLNAQGFTSEDEHLLQAFARMISVKIAMREHDLRREHEQIRQASEVAHGFRHDLGNVLWAAKLQLNDLPLASHLAYLPGLLADAARMVDRSWIATKVAAGTYAPAEGEQSVCDLAAVLADLFRTPERYLAPDPDSGVNLLLHGPNPPDGPLAVRCDRTLLEITLLALPVWLFHHAQVAADDQTPAPLPTNLSVEASEHVVRLEYAAAVVCDWHTGLDQDKAGLGGFHVNYPKLLSCPLVPLEALASKLAFYGARLTTTSDGHETRMRIELQTVEPALPATPEHVAHTAE